MLGGGIPEATDKCQQSNMQLQWSRIQRPGCDEGLLNSTEEAVGWKKYFEDAVGQRNKVRITRWRWMFMIRKKTQKKLYLSPDLGMWSGKGTMTPRNK